MKAMLLLGTAEANGTYFDNSSCKIPLLLNRFATALLSAVLRSQTRSVRCLALTGFLAARETAETQPSQ